MDLVSKTILLVILKNVVSQNSTLATTTLVTTTTSTFEDPNRNFFSRPLINSEVSSTYVGLGNRAIIVCSIYDDSDSDSELKLYWRTKEENSTEYRTGQI